MALIHILCAFSLPERSGMWIACFNVRMKVVLNVKVSRTVGVGTDQDPEETNMNREAHMPQSLGR